MTHDENGENKAPDFFEKFGLQLGQGQVEIGKTYPVYGMITAIEEVREDFSVVAIINRNIRAILNIKSKENVDLLHNRVFEPGIFITTFDKILTPTEENPVAFSGEVSTVVFGKAKGYDA
jgi:transcriptional regulator of NAD metabolism